MLFALSFLGQIPMDESTPRPLNREQQQAKDRIEALGGGVLRHYGVDGPPLDRISFKDRFTDAEIPLLWPFCEAPPISMGFGKAKLTDRGVASALQRFPSLKGLTIWQMPVGDIALAPLEHFDQLEEVSLGETQITSETLRYVGKQAKLFHLTISETNVDDSGMRHLEQLKELKRLFVGNTRLTSAGLGSIAKITSLQSLLLNDTQVDDEGLHQLTPLENLEVLRLDGTQVTNAGMVHIAKLKSLKTLYVHRTKVDENGLAALQNMPKLEEVRWVLVPDKATPEQKRFHFRFHAYLPAHFDRARDAREKFERGELKFE
jgi:hypothetical protein